MKSCPHCHELQEENIDFVDRDIDENSDEYDVFVKATQNDFVPALLIIQEGGQEIESFLYAPDRDYEELTEAVQIIKKHI